MKDGKRCFVLIDQSVKKPGGHHYEYAQRILDAAREQGYETVLLAHKDYSGQVTHEVRPAFSMTFWDNYRHYYGGGTSAKTHPLIKTLARLSHTANYWRLTLKRRFIFSKNGLALTRARHLRLRHILLKPHLDEDFSEVPSPRFTLLVGWGFLKIGALARKATYALKRLRLRRALFLLASLLLAPIALPVLGLIWVRRRDPAKVFAHELRVALSKGQIKLGRSIVFVPNATAAELHGLALLARWGHRLTKAQWAFLYRRPVFSGYPSGYKRQMEAVRRHRVELARLKSAMLDDNVRFYTDTDELTAQYDLLGVYPFQTLPVPVEPLPAKPACDNGPLIIGYLGDARDEKGFQHLPKLVESFRSRPGAAAHARFLFQANFNVPEGEPGSRYARSMLETYHTVELVHGPFDSREYNALLQRMDIVLIPYAAENYSARSSGVLMEALSAGLPVLVPACSWMAGLIEPARQRHFLSLFAVETPVDEVIAPYQDIAGKILPVNDKADHVLIRLRFVHAFEGYVRITIASINEFDIPLETTRMGFKATNGEVNAVFSKPRSQRFSWEVHALDADVHPLDVQMQFYAVGKTVPLGAGAAVFDRTEDIPNAVHELVDFYAHHKSAAEDLRKELRPLYDSAMLVEKIGRDAFERNPATTDLERVPI